MIYTYLITLDYMTRRSYASFELERVYIIWVSFYSYFIISHGKSAHISFHQIDKNNNARIKYQRVNSITGKPVEWSDIIKGYEYDKETMIGEPDNNNYPNVPHHHMKKIQEWKVFSNEYQFQY